MGKSLIIGVAVIVVAAIAFFVVAANTDTTEEVAIASILSGKWPASDTDPSVIKSRDVTFTGWVGHYDLRNPRQMLVCGELPPHEGALPSTIRVVIREDAILPEDLVREAEVFMSGSYDPATQTIEAWRVTAKCPSARKQDEAPAPPENDM